MEERFDYDGLLEVNEELREQNRVLREALVVIRKSVNTRDEYASWLLGITEAALTATSQPTAAEVHQRMFDHGDATSQEGQHESR